MLNNIKNKFTYIKLKTINKIKIYKKNVNLQYKIKQISDNKQKKRNTC